jgi:flavin-dependent dehydrogenase
MNNVFELDNLHNPDEDEDGKWEEFCYDLKENVFRGAYFVIKNDGTVHIGCTEQDRLGQERMLYKLKGILEYYLDVTPDFELLEAIKANAKLKNIELKNEELLDFDDED